MLDTEKELLKEKIKEALIQQSQEQKVILEVCSECRKNVLLPQIIISNNTCTVYPTVLSFTGNTGKMFGGRKAKK